MAVRPALPRWGYVFAFALPRRGCGDSLVFPLPSSTCFCPALSLGWKRGISVIFPVFVDTFLPCPFSALDVFPVTYG